jgi:phytol kinase
VVPIAAASQLDRGLALGAAGSLTLLAALNHRMRLLPGIEDVGRHSYGTVAYGAAVTLLLWLYWPEHAAAAIAGVLVMAVGDGLAGIVGPAVTSPRWRVLGQTKSLAGTAAMAAASLLTLLLIRAGVAGGPDLPQLALITLVATALEQLAWAGLDNLTVPVAVGVLWAS